MPSNLEEPQLVSQTESSIRTGPADAKLFVVALRCGRLGNRLILFANFVALVEEQGGWVYNPTFHSYSSCFAATRRDIFCRYPPPDRISLLDAMPPLAGAIRATRLFYRLAHAASELQDRWRILGRRV